MLTNGGRQEGRQASAGRAERGQRAVKGPGTAKADVD